MKRKVLAWLMSLLMVFNMVVPYAFADDMIVDGDQTQVSDSINDEAGNSESEDVNTPNENGNSGLDDQSNVGDTTTVVVTPANDGDANADINANANANANAVVGNDNTEYAGEEENGEQPVVDGEQPVGDVPQVGVAAPMSVNEGIMPVADEPATSGSCGATETDNVTWKYDAATTTLTISGTGAIKGYFSSGLYPWSSYSGSITKVVMESGVTGFGINSSDAFNGYTALKEVSIADTVTDIGQYTFKGCTALTSVTLPDNIKELSGTFQNCTKLATVKLPAKLEKLTYYAFQKCTALTTITLPESLTEIGDQVFQNSGLTTITIPDKVTTIGKYAFNKSELVSVKLPDSVTSIGKYAFQASGKLKEVTLPANLTEIPAYTFKNCTALETITIPDSVTTIDNEAFIGCTALKSFNFPAKLATLGKSAFDGCTSLTGAITIPQTVTKLDDKVFKGCTGITEVTVPSSVTEWGRSKKGAIFQDCTGITKATVGAIAPADMFKGCTALKEVKILDGVTSFGNTTFSGCTALSTIEVPAGLTDWGNGAFNGVDTSKITFTGAGKDNFAWDGDVLYNKDKTTLMAAKNITGEFSVPDTVTTIGPNSFSGCTGLTAVKFGENSKLATIGDNAFDGCTGLTSFDFPKGELTLGAFVFQGTGIENLVIPANVKEFGEMGNMPNLTTVKIYAPITSLPARAFNASTKLETIYIPANVTGIYMYTLPVESTGSLKYIYYGGTKAQFESGTLWSKQKNDIINNGISVIYNYVESTTEDGKLQVVAQPADIACDNVAAQATDITMQLKYPDGVTAAAGDKIWVDWYYTTQETPNGLAAVRSVTATAQEWDADTLTATCALTEQAGKGEDNTWHYMLVAYKTDADGNTTMLVSDPVKVALTNKEVEITGAGTEEDPYVISNADQMIVVAANINSGKAQADSYIKLAADIELPKGWAQLGSGKTYTGTFDGDGHTITFANGAKGLIKQAGGAVIKNLNIKGEYISGNGLIDTTDKSSATITDCKILSGTTILNSGFVGETGGLTATNCVVEDGVKIGWNAAKNTASTAKGVGSIVGWGSFNIMSCESAADVYGTSNVGGIAGFKGYSMRSAIIKNCGFTGSVTATGEFAGGIIARGYDAESAPNTPATNIDNCYVIADISGVQGVGGIFGGEAGLDQCWDNGIQTLRDCLFYGSVKTVEGTYPEHSGSDGYKVSSPANNVGGSKGGIVGFMRSLNKNNVIENNYYYITDGKDVAAIGAVEHIDTTAIPASAIKTDFTGEGTDTPQEYYKNWMDTFYYSSANAETESDLADLKWFVDREDYGTDNWTEYSSIIKVKLNRTDDPLGADKDKLGKAVTAAEMKDATVVLKALNESDSSLHNWVLEENAVCPTLSDAPIAYALEIGGDYKTEYYIGDELDMTGATFTAYWSDDTTTNPELKDVKITGFDSKERKVLTLTASYGSASTQFQVSVLKASGSSGGSAAPSTIKVKFTLYGDEKHDEYGKEENLTIHTLAKNNLTTWIPQEDYTIGLNDTVWDLLQKVAAKHDNVKFSNPNGNYVDKVTFDGLTMEEKDNTPNSGWMYTLNGHHPLLAVNEQFLENGDRIVFHWTDDYTIEEGSEDFDNSGNHLGGGGGSSTTVETKYTVSDVKNLISAIGTVTNDSKSAIEKARTAYDSLTAANQQKVSNYDVLVAAEKAYTELTGEKIEAVTAGSMSFSDVKSGAWYYDAVKKMYDKGLMKGEDGNRFNPDNKLSRAMLVTVLYRMQSEPTVVTAVKFGDIKTGLWYSEAVAWANEQKIAQGVENNKFAPDASITRQELATMLYRFAGLIGLDTAEGGMGIREFSDWEQISEWAMSAMQWAVACGLMQGNDDGTINPNGAATRAEVATVIVRLEAVIAK